ncbi:MAG: HAMP domain-containing sensor histidine kinase [Moraxellaceae bacterium]|nr:HAMP domain-containing sensor histidine kinase [Moraxellaceae bacterium]
MKTLLPPGAVDEVSGEADTRATSLRYYCFYRIVIASLLALFGAVLKLGSELPALFAGTIGIYWLASIAALMILPRSERAQRRWLAVQILVDVVALTMLTHADGGYRSGIPYLLMTSLAAAGLVAQGRMVLGFAALATIAVLIEHSLRVGAGVSEIGEYSRIGLIGMGYFAVALVSRMLGRRAAHNAVLAQQRGQDLARQMGINARIIEDMQDGVIVLDHIGHVRLANPQAMAQLGPALRPGGHIGEASRELMRRVLLQEDADAVFRAEHGGATLRLRQVQVDDTGTLVVYLEDLGRLQAQAQQIKLAALGRLTANIAHEIRNPLAAITHASELMLEEKRAEMQSRLVRIVRDNGARIDRMVRDVMDLGRRDRVTTETLDLAAFVGTFLDELTLPSPQLAAMVSIDCEAGLRVHFDRVHLHQILNNLVSNACRYGSAAPGSVQVTTRMQDDMMVLTVSDDGAGIADADRQKVFEPFFTSDPKGTGLGLYIARELAEANGARLILLEPGAVALRGASFRLIARRAD